MGERFPGNQVWRSFDCREAAASDAGGKLEAQLSISGAQRCMGSNFLKLYILELLSN
jgi:hypothetical protein